MKFKPKRKQHGSATWESDDLVEYDESKRWYKEVSEDPKDFPKCTEQVLIELKDEAKKCHDSEVANHHIKNSKTNANHQWMKTVMSKGTVSDKIAAHTVSIQDNPVCNLDTIRNLVGMVKVSKKKECVAVIETLTELFISYLLRPNQKLKAFHQRPLTLLNELSSGNAVTRRKLLSVWYFEDQLKESYTSFVLALNTVSHDTVETNKEKAITAMYKLLSGNPEQEKNLLTYIVNKLGDPSQKVASKVIYCLTQLLFKHTNMQGVVLNEIEKLLFRPNISNRAQYYSLCFLSQFFLCHESSEVARKLIEVYFSFFKACVKKGDVDSRMMSALLMGINRAYPYAKIEFEKVSEHIDTMYRLIHLANFNIGIQALMLLYQVSDFGNNIADRFYAALYKKLLDPNLLSTTHRAMLLSLVYKALLKDKEINRVKVFVKRLLQISLYAQPSFSCGILYLISQLIGRKELVQSLLLKQSLIGGMDDDEEEKYQDVKDENVDGEYTEIEIKEEPEDNEINEKGIIGETSENSPRIDTAQIEIKDEEDDVKPDVEHLAGFANKAASWYHCKNTVPKEKSPTTHYNPLARNPLYGGGEFCAYTELYNLKNHFHPTVSLFATNILNGETVKYSGDPLNDFSLIRFLDRFVFKNPKKIEEKSGRHPTFGKRKLYKPKGVKLLPVYSSGYLKENSENIPVDELFLHSYLQRRYEERVIDDNENSDIESVQSEEFDEMLDKMSGVKDMEDDIDYLNEIGDTMKKKAANIKNKNQTEEESDDSSSDDEIGNEDIDDEDDELSDMDDIDKELIDDLDDDDQEDIEFMDDDQEFSDENISNTMQRNKKKFKKKNDNASLFASADEFATLLEDEGSSKIKPGGSNAFANRDNADMKQLAWEENRNRWLKGFSKAVGGKKAKFGSKTKEFSRKRPNQNKFTNKNKKFKK